ncbi:MAG: H/ACA snoRNP pseudouridylase subunit [Chaenotheca gracillima]|nr:MAG: H/ACA snoRNP pseudouridylase subunit [Chaenotheca gracillima]
MASHPQTPPPIRDVPTPTDPAHLSRGYGSGNYFPASGNSITGENTVTSTDFGSSPAQANQTDSSPTAPYGSNTRFQEEFDASRRGSSLVDGPAENRKSVHRADSTMSNSNTLTPARGGTLKKKASLSRKGSLKRSGSRRSNRAGSVRSLSLGEREKYAPGDEMNSAFYTPVPTSGNPTEILANRFQTWRKVLKDLITYFREIQMSYEHRSKALLKVANVLNNTSVPSMFLSEGGINDAVHTLRNYHKQSISEGNRARDIEQDVITQLTGLRADLNQKIKEIKNLSGDFKNSVDRELEGTKKAVHNLQESLGLVDSDSAAVAGKGDPFIIKLAADRQIERQIDEENYLHKAFLNLEGSGRELESIIVGEIQKAYNAYAGVLKRESDEGFEAVDKLREGPINMSKDHEWSSFVQRDNHFIDPRIPLRRPEDIEYPGRDHPAALEVRAGMLERKSKYLKSYTPGWYVLSSTHLHEFKSADRINSQPPVMSLYLPEQKLGTHSQPGSSSHKFMLKGRQTGSMHRGHAWTFRAESHDTMLAWYEDLKSLTEKTGEERNAFVRKHARSVSGGSQHSKAGSVSSDGALDEDEADNVPYSAAESVNQPIKQQPPARPQPGGRFPSDIQVDRGLQATRSASSGSSDRDRDVVAAATTLPGTAMPAEGHPVGAHTPMEAPNPNQYAEQQTQGAASASFARRTDTDQAAFAPLSAVGDSNFEHTQPRKQHVYDDTPRPYMYGSQPLPTSTQPSTGHEDLQDNQKRDSNYGHWMAPASVMSGGLGSAETRPNQTQTQEIGGTSPKQPQTAGGVPVLVSHETMSESSRSAQPHAALASDASQADSGSTAPTAIDTSPTTTGGLSSNAFPQSDGYMSAGGSKPTATATSTGESAFTGVDPSYRRSMHMPGEYPPTPAA